MIPFAVMAECFAKGVSLAIAAYWVWKKYQENGGDYNG